MEIPAHQIEEIESAVARYFDAEVPAEGKKSLHYSQLFNRLKLQIEYLLRTSHERLWHGLYRIDVPENKVKEAFAAGSFSEIAEALAVLIINREAQKAILRQKYSGNG